MMDLDLMTDLRKIERYLLNGDWETIRLEELKKGDIFRMWEDEVLVNDSCWMVDDLPNKHDIGVDGSRVWGVNARPVKFLKKESGFALFSSGGEGDV